MSCKINIIEKKIAIQETMCIMRRQHETEINRMIRMVETITLKVSIDSYKNYHWAHYLLF